MQNRTDCEDLVRKAKNDNMHAVNIGQLKKLKSDAFMLFRLMLNNIISYKGSSKQKGKNPFGRNYVNVKD